jgi:hypothetical protein
MTARGTSCKVLISHTDLGISQLVALAPGYELVVGNHPLKVGEMRPPDAIARRRHRLMEGQETSVSEISLNSLLDYNPIINGMLRDDNPRELAALQHVSKMAAVLDYVRGTKGFTVAPATGVAVRTERLEK